MLQQKLIDHLKSISHGLISINNKQAMDIIKMITNYKPATGAQAKLFRYAQNGREEPLRTISTSNERINELIIQALADGPTHGFYRYDLFNDKNEAQGSIFTINPNLFD